MKLDELITAINSLKEYPQTTFKWGVVKDPQKFISLSVSYLKANSGKRVFLPYYYRLLDFYLANK